MVPGPILLDPCATGLGSTVVAMPKVQKGGPEQPNICSWSRNVCLHTMDAQELLPLWGASLGLPVEVEMGPTPPSQTHRIVMTVGQTSATHERYGFAIECSLHPCDDAIVGK